MRRCKNPQSVAQVAIAEPVRKAIEGLYSMRLSIVLKLVGASTAMKRNGKFDEDESTNFINAVNLGQGLALD